MSGALMGPHPAQVLYYTLLRFMLTLIYWQALLSKVERSRLILFEEEVPCKAHSSSEIFELAPCVKASQC